MAIPTAPLGSKPEHSPLPTLNSSSLCLCSGMPWYLRRARDQLSRVGPLLPPSPGLLRSDPGFQACTMWASPHTILSHQAHMQSPSLTLGILYSFPDLQGARVNSFFIHTWHQRQWLFPEDTRSVLVHKRAKLLKTRGKYIFSKPKMEERMVEWTLTSAYIATVWPPEFHTPGKRNYTATSLALWKACFRNSNTGGPRPISDAGTSGQPLSASLHPNLISPHFFLPRQTTRPNLCPQKEKFT